MSFLFNALLCLDATLGPQVRRTGRQSPRVQEVLQAVGGEDGALHPGNPFCKTRRNRPL